MFFSQRWDFSPAYLKLCAHIVWNLVHTLFSVDYTFLSGLLSTCTVFFCNDLTVIWLEDYYRHRFFFIVGASFLCIMFCSCWHFIALWLETTLLVRMCFTCAAPAEIIKASAVLLGRGTVWNQNHLESSCQRKQFQCTGLKQQARTSYVYPVLCWMWHCYSFLPGFCVASRMKVCLQTLCCCIEYL